MPHICITHYAQAFRSMTVMDTPLMCERHVIPGQDNRVSLGHRSVRAEGPVKTLRFSDLSLLHGRVTIATFAIFTYTDLIHLAYLLQASTAGLPFAL